MNEHETLAEEEYNFDLKAEEVAKDRGQVVLYPKENQLQIDIDTAAQYKEFQRRIDFFDSVIGAEFKVEEHPSKSGLPARHITITVTGKTFGDWDRIAIQSALGSDPIREYLNAMRCLSGVKQPTRFFETLA